MNNTFLPPPSTPFGGFALRQRQRRCASVRAAAEALALLELDKGPSALAFSLLSLSLSQSCRAPPSIDEMLFLIPPCVCRTFTSLRCCLFFTSGVSPPLSVCPFFSVLYPRPWRPGNALFQESQRMQTKLDALTREVFDLQETINWKDKKIGVGSPGAGAVKGHGR